jgi:hypothetical protein
MMQSQPFPGNPPVRNPILLAGIFLLLTLLPSVAASDHESSPVARVNGIPLYRSDLDCAIETKLARLGRNMKPRPPRKEISSEHITEEALQRIINIELLYQEGLKHRFPGIEEKMEKRYKTELARMGGEEQLSAALSCIDMTGEDLRKTIFRNLIINSYLEKTVYSNVTVTEAELEEYYERNKERFKDPSSVRARQVLIKVKTWSDTREVRSAESRALEVHGEAVKGSDFIRLARKYSEDPSAGSTGGDMGIIYRGNLHKPMESIIFSLPDGGISNPSRTEASANRSGPDTAFTYSRSYPQPLPPLKLSMTSVTNV